MSQRKKRILVVDDDEGVLKSIGDYLKLKGYNVETAKTADEAIEKSKNHFFNLAILDIKLPDMEGTEFLTRMRETEPRTVKIMLTGYPSLENCVESLNKRADAYLIKPVQLDKLNSLIQGKLEQQEKELKMDQERIIKYIESRDRETEESKRGTDDGERRI